MIKLVTIEAPSNFSEMVNGHFKDIYVDKTALNIYIYADEKLTLLFMYRHTFLTMYQQLLMCFPKEGYLLDIFQYIRISADDILGLNQSEVRQV